MSTDLFVMFTQNDGQVWNNFSSENQLLIFKMSPGQPMLDQQTYNKQTKGQTDKQTSEPTKGLFLDPKTPLTI